MNMTIKNLRKSKELTQEQLGEKIGKSKSYICDLENGKRSIAGISAETLLRLSDILDISPELLVDPPETLDDDDFEWEKLYDTGDDSNDYFLVIDDMMYSPRFNQQIFFIDGIWYRRINSNIKLQKSIPIGDQLITLKSHVEKTDSYFDRSYCLMLHCVPRFGFKVDIGRSITPEEFNDLCQKYSLSDDDISNEFLDQKGDIYGDKYKKVYTCVQIRVDPMEAINVEKYLKSKGIEAFNGSSGIVNIRVK